MEFQQLIMCGPETQALPLGGAKKSETQIQMSASATGIQDDDPLDRELKRLTETHNPRRRIINCSGLTTVQRHNERLDNA